MITLITGAPRSGKSLYTVDKLIPPEIGRELSIDDDKTGPQKVTRRVLCNINQLQLDHVMIDADWLQDLHVNRQLGDFVVFDEVQRVWPNRPTGSKIPPAVEYLQTHGHDALDLVILTQGPMLIDPAVRALVGRHLHIRKVGGLGGCIVYEWDGCSNALNFKNAFRKSAYKYSRKAQALYKSAKGHTGSRAALPFALYLVVAGLIGSAFIWPHFFSRLFDQGKGAQAAQVTGKPAPARQDAPDRLAARRAQLDKDRPPPPVVPSVSSPSADPLSAAFPAPLAGCAVVRGSCTCYDTRGRIHDQDIDECTRAAGPARPLELVGATTSPGWTETRQSHPEHDALIAWVHERGK